MTSKGIFIKTAFIGTLLSCNSNSSSKLDTASKTQPDTQTNVQEQYAYIASIFQYEDTTFINADYIQYLTGDSAIEAAKKAHQADTFKTEDGKTHIDIPNDYFIVNERKKIRRLPLGDRCVFDLFTNPDRMHPIADNSLKALEAIYKDGPFVLIINNDGIVVKVKEVFLP
jgi:hypothetical protein